jgi:6-phosphofructokinase 1
MCAIEKVPHLINELNFINIANIPNPILENNHAVNRYGGTGILSEEGFTYQGSYVLGTAVFADTDELHKQKQWLAAGPRKHLFFQPDQVRAAIVTCGGLCPGLNVVIREVFLNLTINFNAMEVWGIHYGYEGFYKHKWTRLDIEKVRRIHLFGGTMLGSSRGGFGINQIYFLGGDGTHKGIYGIA